jgi:hypothetical protein
MISNDPKFNLGQLNAYKLMFAIKLSMEKRIKKNLAAWFSDLPAINATVFTNKLELNAQNNHTWPERILRSKSNE